MLGSLCALRRLVLPRGGQPLVRHGHGYAGGVPGNNLPFDLNRNKYLLTLYFVLFFGSGLSVPFMVVRHQMLRGVNTKTEDADVPF